MVFATGVVCGNLFNSIVHCNEIRMDKLFYRLLNKTNKQDARAIENKQEKIKRLKYQKVEWDRISK